MVEPVTFEDTLRRRGYGLCSAEDLAPVVFRVLCLGCRCHLLVELPVDFTHQEVACLKCGATFTAAGRFWSRKRTKL